MSLHIEQELSEVSGCAGLVAALIPISMILLFALSHYKLTDLDTKTNRFLPVTTPAFHLYPQQKTEYEFQ